MEYLQFAIIDWNFCSFDYEGAWNYKLLYLQRFHKIKQFLLFLNY